MHDMIYTQQRNKKKYEGIPLTMNYQTIQSKVNYL